MKLDTMIDIETLGTQGRPVVVQIGAVLFDPLAGKIENERCWDIAYKHQSRSIDADTVTFWLRQPKETIDQVFFGKDRVPLYRALNELKPNFIDKSERVWSRSTNFDLRILSEAYEAEQWMDEDADELIPFWKWRDERVLRDLLSLAGPLAPPTGTRHNALDDARYQASIVSNAHRLFLDLLGDASPGTNFLAS